jgi:tellurite resistance protein
MKHQEHIIPYLKNQLSSEHKQSFEQAMKSDEALKKAVKDETLLLEQMEMQRLRKKMMALHESEKSNVVASKPTAKIFAMPQRNTFRYAVAASFAGFLAIGLWFFFQEKPMQEVVQNTPVVAPKNTVEKETEVVDLPKKTPSTNPKTKALEKIENNTIVSTTDSYDLAYSDEVKNINGELMGISEEKTLKAAKQLLKNNQVQEAFQLLQQLQKNDKNDEDVEWFLTIAQLKFDKNTAITTLKKIAKKDGKYQDKAEIMLRKLE